MIKEKKAEFNVFTFPLISGDGIDMVIKEELFGRKCSLAEGGACREDRMPKGGAHPGLADEFGLWKTAQRK